MIDIEQIVLREIRLPLVEPFHSAGGVTTERRVLLLAITDRDGTEIWSECVAESTPSYSADTVDTCWLAISEWLAPRVLGKRFATPQAVDAALQVGIRGHRMARAALEMGAWSLAAAKEGVSLAALLSAATSPSEGKSALPRATVDAGIAIGMQPTPGALVERARTALAQGFRRIKMKVAPGRDIAFIGAVRESLGAAPLSADANCSYTLEDPAHVEALTALDAFGLAMIEQPLAPDDLMDHSALQRRLTTPLCLDESIVSRASVRDMIALGSGRMVNLKPGRVGGFTEAIAIHDACHAAGIPVWCGGMLETGIGRAYNVALASLPAFTEPGDLSPSARYWQRDIVTPEWTMDGAGRVRVPLDRAGIGVDVDADHVDRLTVRTLTLRRT